MKLASRASQILSKTSAFPWLPELLAGLAGILYFVQSVSFATTQWSVIDEGNYIYKGWLFVTGQYFPYQDYGPWTNHMPFSFLIFGGAQLLFGPGLRTVRYFMVFVGCLFLLGMWLASRRLAGRWAAAACLWFLALNPFPISDYSVGIAEGLVACMMAWMLYFTLGDGRSLKELFTGSVLAAVLVLTRENMVLILPFLFFYVFWQHGKRAGFLFMGTVTCLVLAVHALYWPGIMSTWVKWMPKGVRSFFGDSIYQQAYVIDQPSKASSLENLFVFFNSVQTNFLAVFASLAVWLCWPKGGFKNRAQFKTVVFLSAVFVVLYLTHAWASLGKNYCAYCLVNYVTFFSPIGILLFFAFLPGIRERQPIFPAWLVGGLILLLLAGIGYGNFVEFGAALASINIPKISSSGFQPGTVELWRALANKFNISFQFARSLLPVMVGLGIGILIIVVGYVVTKIGKASPVYALIFVTLFAGLALSPTVALGGISENARCGNDILAQYEKVGAELAQHAPPGTRVYWRGSPSPALLLYLPGVKIYPPQLNGGFSFKSGSNSDELLRFGFWNRQLDLKWRAEADVLLIRTSELAAMNVTFSPKVFDELPRTSPVFLCGTDDTHIRIFKRK